MKNLKTFRQVLENADYSEFMNSRNIDKPKFMSIVDEVDEDDWFDDTDNFLDIFDDENDTITPEYFIDDSGSGRYWINPVYKGKAINKKDITCKFIETEERGRDIVITKLVNSNGDVILYNISED